MTQVTSKPKPKLINFLGDKTDLIGVEGYSGIIYMLLQSVNTVKSLTSDTELMTAIETTVVKILCFVMERQYCPAKVGTLVYDVNFCKGSPGLIPMLVLAA